MGQCLSKQDDNDKFSDAAVAAHNVRVTGIKAPIQPVEQQPAKAAKQDVLLEDSHLRTSSSGGASSTAGFHVAEAGRAAVCATEKPTTTVFSDVVQPAAPGPASCTAAVAAPATASAVAPAPAPARGSADCKVDKPFATTDPLEVAPELAPQAGLPYQVHMCGPPRPPCDEERLATVAALKTLNPKLTDPSSIVDAPPDPEVASILKLVASIFDAPAALVALFDDRRIFIRDSQGAFSRGDFPWRWSFCGWTMASKNDQIMVIPDATKDYRFANNHMVKQEGVRFYCGTPLIASNGHRLGTLCFADTKPREFDASRCMILNNLAELVVRHIEKDIALQLRNHDNESLTAAYGRLRRTLDCFDHCVALVDTGSPGWSMLYANSSACKLIGLEREQLQGRPISEMLEGLDGRAMPGDALMGEADACHEFVVRARLGGELLAAITGSSGARRLQLKFRPASKEDLDEETLSIGIPSFIPSQPRTDPHQQPGATTTATPERLYFMLLEDLAKVEEREAAEAKAAADAQAQQQRHSSMGGGRSSMSASVVLSSTAMSPPETIQGLQLGHLLGKGGYGSVYYGMWYGTPVAVKIVDEDLPPGQAPISTHSEATLSQELRHPHICATLRCATRTVSRGSGASDPLGVHTPPAHSTSNARAAMSLMGSASVTPAGGNSNGNNNAQRRGCVPSSKGSKNSRGCMRHAAGARGAGAFSEVTFSDDTACVSGVHAGGCEASDAAAVAAAHALPAAGDGARGSEVHSDVAASNQRWAIIQLAPSASGADYSQPLLEEVSGSDDGNEDGDKKGYGGDALHMAVPSQRASAGGRPSCDECRTCPGHDSSVSPFMAVADSFDAPPSSCGMASASLHVGSWHQTANTVHHQTWIVMEYCDKGCLQDAVDRGWLRNSSSCLASGPRMDAVLATALEMASALSFLHARGIVHGDLSAWNVMLCTSGASANEGSRGFVAKIADFGLARHLDVRTKVQTRTYGTLTHMPAETLRDGVISKAVDVYSFGVLLWQMYTGSRPWAGLRHGQIIVMVVTQGARLRFPAATPAPYEDLAMACMDPDASKRPSFEHIVKELQAMKDMGLGL